MLRICITMVSATIKYLNNFRLCINMSDNSHLSRNRLKAMKLKGCFFLFHIMINEDVFRVLESWSEQVKRHVSLLELVTFFTSF